jgi:Cd2+/Zn2+-exporting ATPase
MSEETITIEIPVLIPGLTNHEDGCLARLEGALSGQKGIYKVQVQNHQTPILLVLNYNPAETNIETIRKTAVRVGASIANRFHHETIPVEGMDCSDCVIVLEHGLRRTTGILSANVNYAAQTLSVEYDAQEINHLGLEKRVRQLGYQIPGAKLQNWFDRNHEILFSLASGLLLLLAWGGTTFLGIFEPVALALYLMAYLASGWEVAQHAWHSIRERRFDTDLLMLIAALGAAAMGDFAEGALLLFLFSLGHALEERALDRARGAIHALGKLMPKTAYARRDGQVIPISVDHLQLHDIVVVQPGTRIPVDGVIRNGQSAIDESPVTGESIPVDKAVGDTVFAGTVNGEGALEVEVSRLARDSTLARVIHMVEESQAQKSPTQQVIERFMAWFVPTVLVGAALLVAIPPLFGIPFRESFIRAMTLLVAASPCALALGTPSAILSGVARAARGGVLVKGGMHLENLGRLKAIAFDKTGTITRGKPQLVDVYALDPAEPREVLSLAAAVERWSGHPLAQAVAQGAEDRCGQTGDAYLHNTGSNVTTTTGEGIQALVNGKIVRVGNRKLFAEAGIELPEAILKQVEAFEEQGKTAMVVWQEPQALGVISVADIVREEAPHTLEHLRKMGVQRMIMLTGDQPRAAEYIAHQVGITDIQSGYCRRINWQQCAAWWHSMTASPWSAMESMTPRRWRWQPWALRWEAAGQMLPSNRRTWR